MTLDESPRPYVAFGLTIWSTLSFPELAPGEGDADVVVRRGQVEGDPPGGAANRIRQRSTVDETHLFLEGVARLLIRRGEEIVVQADMNAAPGTVRAFVLGPGLATLLTQRGRLVLHASAVEIDGRAIAFLGGSGWGKSTTAAALIARGHALVADDVLALDIDSCPVRALPGFPQVKLWRETASYLGAPPAQWARYDSAVDKGFQRAANGVFPKPLPLRTIYVLDDGERVEIDMVAARDALIEVVRHSWAAGILRTTAPQKHFRDCSALARKIPVMRIRRPQKLDQLENVIEAIQSEMAAAIP